MLLPQEKHSSSSRESQEGRPGQAAAIEGSFWLTFGRSRRGCEAKSNRNKTGSGPEEVHSYSRKGAYQMQLTGLSPTPRGQVPAGQRESCLLQPNRRSTWGRDLPNLLTGFVHLQWTQPLQTGGLHVCLSGAQPAPPWGHGQISSICSPGHLLKLLCAQAKFIFIFESCLNLPRGVTCLAAAQKPHWFVSLVTGEEKAEQRPLLASFGKIHW